MLLKETLEELAARSAEEDSDVGALGAVEMESEVSSKLVKRA